MSQILLADIDRLTFHKGEKTNGSCLPPIPQLKCVGKPCELFQPEVVRCHNIGGYGAEVDWTCEADLPEKLRFGRVDVSCEGWSGPGDPYVTNGSCGLTYRLVRLPEPVEAKSHGLQRDTIVALFVTTLLLSVLTLLIYLYLRDRRGLNLRRTSSNNPGPGHRSGRPNRGPDAPPAPAYLPLGRDENGDNDTFSQRQPRQSNGEATGGVVGGAAALAAEQSIHRGRYNPVYLPYNWERREQREQPQAQVQAPRTSRRNRVLDIVFGDDEGEGSSLKLGKTRRCTGFGTSTVR